MQVKNKEEIIILRNLIKKTLNFNAPPSLSTPLVDPSAFPQPFLLTESRSKNERWNQVELGYLDSYFDRAHGEEEIV